MRAWRAFHNLAAMAPRILRLLTLTVLLLSAGEVLLLQWSSLAFRGSGLDPARALTALITFGGFNFFAFRWARKRLHSRGISLVLTRIWLLGSIATLLTASLLVAGFAIIGGGFQVAGLGHAAPTALAWTGAACVLIGFGSVLWGASVGNYRIRIDHVKLPSRRFAERHRDLRIAHISDLHIGSLLPPERLGELVARVNQLEPDFVMITGDIFDFDSSYVDAGCAELAQLRGRHGVYAVLGNHDVYTGADIVAGGLERHTSIRLFRDEWDVVEIGGAAMVLAGIEDPGHGWTERESESAVLERLASEIPDELPSLLLAHRPSYFAHAARLDFSVVLSGHTHGGQIALPLAHHYNPSRLISRHTRGIFHSLDSTLYVSRGIGMAGLPLRINCPREIALLQLSHMPY
jgi:predicted MPP superfamily phosphohydrolase